MSLIHRHYLLCYVKILSVLLVCITRLLRKIDKIYWYSKLSGYHCFWKTGYAIIIAITIMNLDKHVMMTIILTNGKNGLEKLVLR